MDAFAAARAETVVQRYRDQVSGVGDDPAARAHALVEALTLDGFAATARPVGAGTLAGIQVCQGTARCTMWPSSSQAVRGRGSGLLHPPGVHVQRLATLAAGHHVCTTFIPTPTHPGSPSAAHERDDVMTTSVEQLNPGLEGIGRYEYGWSDPDAAGASAKRGLDETVVRDISTARTSRSGCSTCA